MSGPEPGASDCGAARSRAEPGASCPLSLSRPRTRDRPLVWAAALRPGSELPSAFTGGRGGPEEPLGGVAGGGEEGEAPPSLPQLSCWKAGRGPWHRLWVLPGEPFTPGPGPRPRPSRALGGASGDRGPHARRRGAGPPPPRPLALPLRERSRLLVGGRRLFKTLPASKSVLPPAAPSQDAHHATNGGPRLTWWPATGSLSAGPPARATSDQPSCVTAAGPGTAGRGLGRPPAAVKIPGCLSSPGAGCLSVCRAVGRRPRGRRGSWSFCSCCQPRGPQGSVFPREGLDARPVGGTSEDRRAQGGGAARVRTELGPPRMFLERMRVMRAEGTRRVLLCAPP